MATIYGAWFTGKFDADFLFTVCKNTLARNKEKSSAQDYTQISGVEFRTSEQCIFIIGYIYILFFQLLRLRVTIPYYLSTIS
jgi:hypothetical protein